MKLIIDRFEGDEAVCETPELGHINVSRKDLPEGVREGDVIEQTDGGYFKDSEATEERRSRIREKLRSLMKE